MCVCVTGWKKRLIGSGEIWDAVSTFFHSKRERVCAGAWVLEEI